MAAQKGGDEWDLITKSFKEEVKAWGALSKTPDTMLKEVEQKMAKLLDQNPADISKDLEAQYQPEHTRCLLMQERYWGQRSRVGWAIYGDKNTKFYHASKVTRRRRNSIGSLLTPNGEWITNEVDIKKAFISHFRSIFTGGPRDTVAQSYPLELLQSLNKVDQQLLGLLEMDPSAQEIKSVVMSLGANKAPGPDGISASLI